MAYKVLLVDDDQNQLKLLDHIVHDKMHLVTKIANSGQEAIDIISSGKNDDIDLVILDIIMPDINGINVLRKIKPMKPNLPIIVRTGAKNFELSIEAMKAGAVDLIEKHANANDLEICVNNALKHHVIKEELQKIQETKAHTITFDNILGKSKAVLDMKELGKKVAASNLPVLIEGESGTGKEFLAKAIHAESKRSNKNFIAVNCGAIPENLVESILFGHEKGAFTGALYKTYGKFREAEGGTIFLDEVGELKPDIQVKLLRVLQEGEIDPVGATRPVRVDVRLIYATNLNLVDEVKNKNFREDLYYRLNVFPIDVPALRHRKKDIKLLAENFIKEYSLAEGKYIKGLTEEALQLLNDFSWPGNIRQLKNSIFRAVVLCDNNKIDVKDFSQISGELNESNFKVYDDIQEDKNIINLLKDNDFKRLNEVERELILRALSFYNGHISKVAEKLGIGRSTLYRKMEEYNINQEVDHA